VIIEV